MMNYKVENGSMFIPELHDAELTGMRHDAKGETIELVFRKPDGQCSSILLNGIVQFRCTDFGLQNVVFELIVNGVNETLSEDEIRSHVIWMSITDSREQLANPVEIEAIVKLVSMDKLLLIVLMPSWGAQVVATTKDISWLG